MPKIKSLKWNIHINQLVLNKLAPELDLKDAAILDYLKDFIMSTNTKIKRITREKEGRTLIYTWIHYPSLINALPILQLKQKASISSRIKKLEKAGFIETYQESDNTLFVRFTPTMDLLSMAPADCLSKLTAVSKNKQGPVSVDLQHNTKDISNTMGISKDIPNKTMSADSKKKKGSPVHRIFEGFIESCEGLKGFTPVLNHGRDGSVVKRRLRQFTEKELLDCIDWYLSSTLSKEWGISLKTALCAQAMNKWQTQRDPM